MVDTIKRIALVILMGVGFQANSQTTVTVDHIFYELPINVVDRTENTLYTEIDSALRMDLTRLFTNADMLKDKKLVNPLAYRDPPDLLHTLSIVHISGEYNYDFVKESIEPYYRTIQRTLPYPPYETYDTTVLFERVFGAINKIRFSEKWEFDVNTLRLQKRIFTYYPTIPEYDFGEYSDRYPYALVQEDELLNIKKMDLLLDDIEYDVLIQSNVDEIWQNGWMCNNLEYSKRINILSPILTKVYSGERKSYDIATGEENGIGKVRDMLTIVDPEDQFQMPVNLSNIKKIRFKEAWYFNKKTFEFRKVVKAYAPVLILENETQTEEIPLFWIMNK